MARKGNRGESLIEAMFALLVGSLSVMLLATMISASAKLIRQGEEDADTYTEKLNRMNDFDDGDTGVIEINDGAVKIQFDSHGDEGWSIYNIFDEINVKTKSFRDGAGKPVIAYEKVKENTEDTGDT